MKRVYGVALGRLRETLDALPNPERWAYKAGPGAFADYTLQQWPNRASMVRTIRMQERGVPRADHWRAVVKLETTEGY